MRDDREYVEVQVVGVGQDPLSRAVVVLRDDQERQLHIWIGNCEAIAIVQRQDDELDPPRPLTHDLALSLWRRLGAELTQLRIDDLWQEVYYSKLSFDQHGQTVDIDCRPSDGIAMALAGKVPIFVAEHVMADSGIQPTEEE